MKFKFFAILIFVFGALTVPALAVRSFDFLQGQFTDLPSMQSKTVFRLLVSENCPHCDHQIRELGQCKNFFELDKQNPGSRSLQIVLVGSQRWALRVSKSVRLKIFHFFQVDTENSKEVGLVASPQFEFGNQRSIGFLSCDEIEKRMK